MINLSMMKLHYEVIHKTFRGRYRLLYSDTDSLVYSIIHDDIYEWVKENRQYFDLSDSLRLDMKDNTNKKVPGVFSDDMHSLVIKKFTALNPKCYSYIKTTLEEMARSYPNLFKYYEDPKDKILTEVEGKQATGVPTAIIKNELKNKDY